MSESTTPENLVDSAISADISATGGNPIQPIDPNDTVAVLRAKLEENPTDILSYLELVQFYEKKDQIDESKAIYDDLHSKFPYYSLLWCLQLKSDLQRDEFETVEKILAQCLSGDYENNDISLWLTYLDYVRRKNNLITGGQEARAIVVKAFELVLEKCAVFEPTSAQFWLEYLSFLEQWKPVNKWEEQQKVDLIRKLYKNMLCIPFNNLEQMWNKYTQWEQDVNSLTARKFIGEISGEYMKARSLYQEWSNVTKGLRRITPLNINSANKKNIQQDNVDVKQLEIWEKWIQWEKDNKLVLGDDQLKARILYVYKQSIQHMLFSPEIWYNYTMNIDESDSTNRTNILTYALRANPTSLSLTIKLVEFYELENNVEKVKDCFDTTINAITNIYNRKNALLASSPDDKLSKEIDDLKEKVTFLYCTYMNTVKKLSGLSAARSVFGKCRKMKNNLTHNIYIENAYIEYYNQKDGHKTALKVLGLGLKYFQADGKYINEYLNFLILLNEDSEIKTLFESSVVKITDKSQLHSIFKKMIGYETKYGNLSKVYSLEKRFLEKFPSENMIDMFSNRYELQNENLIKKLELKYMYNPERDLALARGFETGRTLKRSYESDDNNDNDNSQDNQANKRLNTGGNASEVPDSIVNLLKILPKRQYFKNAILDPSNLVDYLVNQIEIPNNK